MRRKASSLEERRKIEDLTRDVQRLDRELGVFHIELEAAPSLRELRMALATLIVSAQGLESRVSKALDAQQEEPGR